MRIVGGQASGRPLRAPAGGSTRPTGERVREALFNRLGAWIPGARVLDLYAGSGALGLEALSWGAERVTLVENDRRAVQAIRQNVRNLGMTDRTLILARTAETAIAHAIRDQDRYDLILCDPPWREGLSPRVRHGLGEVLASAGWLVVEHRKGDPVPVVKKLDWVTTRTYGDTALSWWKPSLKGGESDGTGGALSGIVRSDSQRPFGSD